MGRIPGPRTGGNTAKLPETPSIQYELGSTTTPGIKEEATTHHQKGGTAALFAEETNEEEEVARCKRMVRFQYQTGCSVLLFPLFL